MDVQTWALLSTIVVLSVATYFLGPILLGALLRSLSEQSKDPESGVEFCIGPKDNQIFAITRADQFEDFYLHSDDYTFFEDLDDPRQEEALGWLENRNLNFSGNLLRYHVFPLEGENHRPPMNWFQRWAYDKFGIYVYQNKSFAKKLHFYQFDHRKLEIDDREDGEDYRIVTHTREFSPWIYTKRFTLAIPVNDAEDYYGVKTSIKATFTLRCVNPYIALFMADNYAQQIYARILNGILYFVRDKNLVIAALRKDTMEELTEEVEEQESDLKEKFSQYLINMTWRDTGKASETEDQSQNGTVEDVSLGLMTLTGFEIIDADLTDVKLAPSQEEAIRPALDKIFTEALNRRASVDQKVTAKNLAEADSEYMDQIQKYGVSGRVYHTMNKLAESKIRVLGDGSLLLNVDAEAGDGEPTGEPEDEGGDQ